MEHSFGVYDIPEIHKDPFDRMLIAQARSDGLLIITAGSFIKQYDVVTYW
jgi:PIN domain nuclease of toxin-antitoxin system